MTRRTYPILVVLSGSLADDRSASGIQTMLDRVRSYDAGYGKFTVEIMRLQDQPGLAERLKKYKPSQLWLFGGADPENPVPGARPLTNDEATAIAEFMRTGGGVFATGDHRDVGESLCGNVPRIDKMRYWKWDDAQAGPAPAENGDARADTRWPPTGRDSGETDATAKTVWGLHTGAGMPHLLLDHFTPSGLAYLPDHQHEGECCAGPRGVSDDEMTMAFGGKERRPQIVAWSVRRGLKNGVALEPRVLPILCCYDGADFREGRIVTESTFHHWTEKNIAPLRGTPAWDHVAQYPINVAVWLAQIDRDKQVLRELVDYVIPPDLRVTKMPEDQRLLDLLGKAYQQRAAELGVGMALAQEALRAVVAPALRPEAETGELVTAYLQKVQ